MLQTFSVRNRAIEGMEVCVPGFITIDEVHVCPCMIRGTLSSTVVITCGDGDAGATAAYTDFACAPASIRSALRGDVPKKIDLGNIKVQVYVPYQLGGESVQEYPLSELVRIQNEQGELFTQQG